MGMVRACGGEKVQVSGEQVTCLASATPSSEARHKALTAGLYPIHCVFQAVLSKHQNAGITRRKLRNGVDAITAAWHSFGWNTGKFADFMQFLRDWPLRVIQNK